MKARHGHAVLFDGHSIRSQLPWLFTGRLPALNLGTAGGASCAPSLRERLSGVLQCHAAVFDHVVDGRFKGGHITRAHGRPHDGVHAVQMQMCWRCSLDEARPRHGDGTRAAPAQALLRESLRCSIEWRPRSSEAVARVGSARSPE